MSRPAPEPSGNGRPALDWAEVHRRLSRLSAGLTQPGQLSPEEQQRILQERALALARPAEPATPAEPSLELVAFAAAGELYGIESAYVREVVAVREITPLPTVPRFLAGIFNLRGQIISVVDLKRLFDLPQTGLSDFHTVLVLQSRTMEFGLLVDRVLGTERVLASQLQAGLPTLSGPAERFLKGLTPERLALLDGARLLSDPSLVIHEEV